MVIITLVAGWQSASSSTAFDPPFHPLVFVERGSPLRPLISLISLIALLSDALDSPHFLSSYCISLDMQRRENSQTQ